MRLITPSLGCFGILALPIQVAWMCKRPVAMILKSLQNPTTALQGNLTQQPCTTVQHNSYALV